MSKINDLIKEMCPKGVKKIPLGSLMNRIKEKNYDNSGINTVYSVTKENGIVKSDDLHDFNVYSDDLSNYSILRKNQYAYNPARLNIGSIARLKNDEVGLVSPMYVIFELDQGKIDLEYFEHLLFSQKVFNDMCSFVEQGARFRFDYKNWNKIIIDLPPLKIQKEIVRILNKFLDMQNILEEELEARKSQYEFWREKLLNDRKYSVVSLGDYATFSQGIQVDPKDQKDYCDGGMVPFLRIVDFVKDDEPPRYIIKPDNKYIKKENEEMVMIRYGASAAGKVFINKYGAIANNMFKINLTTNEIDIKYLWHYLSQDKIYKSLNNTGGGSTMPAINFKMASSIQVVLPPKEEQNRIVKILDKFEELANDITVGLPAEIELRRKQYEYYRNKLLSFEELSVSE